MTMVATADMPRSHHATRFGYIDALRGYAVLMVITSHAAGVFEQLPYPVRKLTNFGWFGVELFFLMSCVTLLLSWRSDEARGDVDLARFWLRRLFRIVPMYYLVAVFYFVVDPPKGGFDVKQGLATFAFLNAWTPNLLPTAPDRWVVVPGGWSIGVEFTFYAIFPLIAMKARSLRAALMFCACAFALGCVANPLMRYALAGSYGQSAIDNFIFFWFPNQLPVFAMGTVLLIGIQAMRAPAPSRAVRMLHGYGTKIILCCLSACILIAEMPFPKSLPFTPPYMVPALYMASAVFMVLVLALAADPGSPFINRPVRMMGKVSFSAFLLHFAILRHLSLLFPSAFGVTATGWRAILDFACFWSIAVSVIFMLSFATFHLIENPMIGLGRIVLARRRGPRGQVPA